MKLINNTCWLRVHNKVFNFDTCRSVPRVTQVNSRIVQSDGFPINHLVPDVAVNADRIEEGIVGFHAALSDVDVGVPRVWKVVSSIYAVA